MITHVKCIYAKYILFRIHKGVYLNYEDKCFRIMFCLKKVFKCVKNVKVLVDFS